MFTRNQSNGDLVNKLMSNKFPLRAVIMEKSGQMEQLEARVDLLRGGGRIVQLQPHGLRRMAQHRARHGENGLAGPVRVTQFKNGLPGGKGPGQSRWSTRQGSLHNRRNEDRQRVVALLNKLLNFVTFGKEVARGVRLFLEGFW